MRKNTFNIMTVVMLVICFSVMKPLAVPAAEKLGVLFVDAGETADYDPRFLYEFYEHLFPFCLPDFLPVVPAGRAAPAIP